MAQDYPNGVLDFGYWYVTHKLLLKRILIGVLIGINTLLIGYVVFALVQQYAIRYTDFRADLQNLRSGGQFAQLQAIRQSQYPQNLRVTGIRVFETGTARNLVATVANPNSGWAATFEYYFQVGDSATAVREGFIYPGESKSIIDLGVTDVGAVRQLMIENVLWEKVNNFSEVYAERYDFPVENVVFTPSRTSEISDQVPISRVRFDITNETPYNYNNPVFLILLRSGGQVVAVNTTATAAFLSGETETIEATWFQNLPQIQDVQIIPQINIFDEDAYLDIGVEEDAL